MSNLRVSGMVSGMDTDEIVKNMMKVERMKVDVFEQNRQIALWRQEEYNNMNKLFANFILNTKKDLGLNQVNIRGAISSKSYSGLDYVKKASSSDETKAIATSTSSATNGNFEIDITKLASSASFTSKVIGANERFGEELRFTLSTGEGKPSKEIVVKNANGVTMGDITKTINSAKVEITEGDKTKEVSLGVTSFYDKENGRLFMQTMETGEGLDIVISNVIIEDGKTNPFQVETSVAGASAELIYNGITLKYSSNNFTLNGINIEAKAIGKTNIKVETNVQGIYDKVEKLVNDYNELIDKASSLLGQKRYPSYKPLSMEEKKALHEDDAKQLEEKAKSGLLNNDATINRILQSMRAQLYETLEGVDGSFKHITDIGISTEKYSQGSAGGKLQIDKDKLMDAILKDPEGVMELLFKEPKYGEGVLDKVTSLTNERTLNRDQITAKRAQSGIFSRIYDELITGMQNIIDKSGSGENAGLYRSVKSNILLEFVTSKSSISDIDRQVTDMNRRLDNLNTLLNKKEDSYYAKFTQMEKYMQKMYSQSSWLSQQFM